MDNPYGAHLNAMKEKLARERETEVTVKLKGKHLSAIRNLTFHEMHWLDKENDKERYELLEEVDNLLWLAMQRL